MASINPAIKATFERPMLPISLTRAARARGTRRATASRAARRNVAAACLAAGIAVLVPLPAWAADASCVPVQVAVFTNRLHVRCAAAIGGIHYFAMATSDAALSARVLSVLTTAQVAGRTLGIEYEPSDTTGAAIGCQPADCRVIHGVWFGQ
jgi:hypothetical protein